MVHHSRNDTSRWDCLGWVSEKNAKVFDNRGRVWGGGCALLYRLGLVEFSKLVGLRLVLGLGFSMNMATLCPFTSTVVFLVAYWVSFKTPF